MKHEEFIELLNLYIDHEITAADAARLEEAVRSDPARLRIYRQYCRIDRAAHLLAAAPGNARDTAAARPDFTAARRPHSPLSAHPVLWGTGLAAACAAFALIHFVRTPGPAPAAAPMIAAVRHASPASAPAPAPAVASVTAPRPASAPLPVLVLPAPMPVPVTITGPRVMAVSLNGLSPNTARPRNLPIFGPVPTHWEERDAESDIPAAGPYIEVDRMIQREPRVVPYGGQTGTPVPILTNFQFQR